MSMARIGAVAVLQGVQEFIANSNQMRAAIQGVNGALGAIPPAAGAASAAMTGVGAAATSSIGPIGVIATAVVTAVAAFAALTAAATASAIGIVAAGVKIASGFQENLQKVAAVTDSTREQLQALHDTAIQVSLGTGKSLGDVSEAAFELAKAGVDLKTQLDGALASVVNLSIASGGERGLADAARDVATGIKAFGLSGADAARVADALTNAAQGSRASFTDLGVGLSYVASTAHALNFTIEDTTTFLGMLSNAGIRGSTAGTGLRQALVQLIDPSKEAAAQMQKYGISLFDAAGKSRPARDVLVDLEGAFGDNAIAAGKLTEAQRLYALNAIFTTRGANAMLAVIQQGTAEFDRFTESANRLTATNVAERMLLPLNQQFGILTNSIQIALNALGEGFIPLLSEATAAALRFANDGAMSVQKALNAIGLAIADIVTSNGLGEVFDLLGQAGIEEGSALQNGIRRVIDILLNLRDAIMNDVVPAIGEFLGWLGKIAETTSGINTDPIVFGIRKMGQAIAFVLEVIPIAIDDIRALFDALGTLVDVSIQVAQIMGGLNDALFQSMDEIGRIVEQTFSDIVSSIGDAIGSIGSLIGSFIDLMGAGVDAVLGFSQNVLTLMQQMASGILDSLAPIGDALGALGEAFGASFSAMGEVVNGFAQVVGEAINFIVEAITGVLIQGFQLAGQALGALGEFFGTVWQAIAEAAAAAVSFVGEVLSTLTSIFGLVATSADQFQSEVGQSFGQIAGQAATATSQTANAMAPLADAFSAVVNAAASFAEGVAANFSGLASAIGTIINNILNGIRGLLSGLASIGAGLADLPGPAGEAAAALSRAAGAVGSLGVSVGGAGVAVVRGVSGIGDQIRGMASSVGSAVNQAANVVSSAGSRIGANFDSIAGRAQAAIDKLRAVPDIANSLNNIGRGSNLDNYIRNFNGLADSVGNVGRAADGTTPGLDNMGNAGKGAGSKGKEGVDELTKAIEDLEEEIDKLQIKFENLQREAANKLAEIATKAATANLEAIVQAGDEIDKAYQKANTSVAELQKSVADSRALRERKQALDDELEAESRAFKRSIEDRELAERGSIERINTLRKRAIEDYEVAIQRAQDASDRTRNYARDDARVARSYAQDDAREQRDRARQIQEQLFKDNQERLAETRKKSGATDEQIKEFKRQQDLEYTKFKQDLDDQEKQRQRAEEQAERLIRRQEDEEDDKLKQAREDEARTRKRAQEDAEADINLARDKEQLQKKRKIEEEEDAFKRKQAKKRQDIEDKEEDARIAARIEDINSERDARIQEILILLAKKQEKIKEDAEEETRKYKVALDERMADLKDALTTKTQQLLKEHAELIQPAVDNIFSIFSSHADATLALYESIRAKLQEVIDLQNQLGPGNAPGSLSPTPGAPPQGGSPSYGRCGAPPGPDWILASENPCKWVRTLSQGTPNPPNEGGDSEGYQSGGLVPGPYGKRRRITAHGGEVYAGLNFEFADRIAEALAPMLVNLAMPYVGAGVNNSNVSNTTNFNLNANYADIQSPVTLANDIQALIMLSQR